MSTRIDCPSDGSFCLTPENIGTQDFLSKVFRAHASAFAGLQLLIVHHVREDAIELLRALRGADVGIIGLIGPEYSAQDAALVQARAEGFDVAVASFAEIPALVERIAGHWEGGEFGIVDTGGYAADLKAIEGLTFRVEMTNHGLWKYRESSCDGLVEMAATTNKAIENIFVGRAIVNAILQELGLKSFSGIRLGVVGYGGIGSNVAHFAIQRRAIVSICEKDPSKLVRAVALGFEPDRPSYLGREQPGRRRLHGAGSVPRGRSRPCGTHSHVQR